MRRRLWEVIQQIYLYIIKIYNERLQFTTNYKTFTESNSLNALISACLRSASTLPVSLACSSRRSCTTVFSVKQLGFLVQLRSQLLIYERERLVVRLNHLFLILRLFPLLTDFLYLTLLQISYVGNIHIRQICHLNLKTQGWTYIIKSSPSNMSRLLTPINTLRNFLSASQFLHTIRAILC